MCFGDELEGLGSESCLQPVEEDGNHAGRNVESHTQVRVTEDHNDL